MKDYPSGAYIISRGGRRGSGPRSPRRRPSRAAGMLIVILLLLTAGICLLVLFMPKMSERADGNVNFKGKTFHFLSVATATDRSEALMGAQNARERGGAGYVFNNGSYRIIAAVYDRESDAKTLASVNDGADYFPVALPPLACSESDRLLLECIAGEFFTSVFTAATELDRGNISDSAAEFALLKALSKLEKLAQNADNAALARTVRNALEKDITVGMSVLSFVRYIQVYVVAGAYEACGG